MKTMITDEQIIELLHAAFVPGTRNATADMTLLGAVGTIDSDVDGRILLLGSGNGNDFHAIPLDLDALRNGIDALVRDTLSVG